MELPTPFSNVSTTGARYLDGLPCMDALMFIITLAHQSYISAAGASVLDGSYTAS